MKLKSNPVKIAIIDNGVNKLLTSNRASVKGGRSFVVSAGGEELPWWSMADPHGQHMASIISEINPDCDLYIARVAKGMKNVDLECAAKVRIYTFSLSAQELTRFYIYQAVDWAVSLGVDVLSISWTSRVLSANLQKAIEKALSRDILIICSTADEGRDPGKIYPARIDHNVITVSACDQNGDRRGTSQAKVDVLILGQDVPVKGPKYIRRFTHSSGPPDLSGTQPGFSVASGSSVATAVTVGVTSFLLELYRYANANANQDLRHRFQNKSKVLDQFEKMRKEGEAFVSPDHFLVDGLTSSTEIDRHFKMLEEQ
jgi:subtilisin family serine protease